MTTATRFLTFILAIIATSAFAQPKAIDPRKFFQDDRVVDMDLSVDIKNLLAAKKDTNYVPAAVTLHFPDSSLRAGNIRMKPKGQFRRKNCYLASLQLDFKNQASPELSPLKKIKMIGGCGKSSSDEQLLFKEYLTYKLFNLFTEMSFRVRLLHVTYRDSREKMKPYQQYAFFIEDMDELARRNQCRSREQAVQTEQADRKQMTMVAFFEYMIGNTDWSVPGLHNVKLMSLKKDSLSNPFVIPYDFDFTGFVDASYATPPEMLGTTKITERVYRGYARTPEEIEEMRNIFLAKETVVKKTISDFTLLDNREKKEALSYIDEFYEIAKSKKRCQTEFIDNARQE